MTKISQILLTVITLISLNSCSEKIVYVEPYCPTLETWKVDKLNDIHFEVKTVVDNE